jgi:hypothetical protein
VLGFSDWYEAWAGGCQASERAATVGIPSLEDGSGDGCAAYPHARSIAGYGVVNVSIEPGDELNGNLRGAGGAGGHCALDKVGQEVR